MDRFEEEARIGKAGTLAAQLCRPDVVVLDELGYLPFARSGEQFLFHLVSKLYERTSVFITTTWRFGKWRSQDDDGHARPAHAPLRHRRVGNDSWRLKHRS